MGNFIVNRSAEEKEDWEMPRGVSSQRLFPVARRYRDRLGDAITIRLSPSMVLVTKWLPAEHPLISVHSIYVRLSRPADRRGDNDLPV